MKYFWSGFKAIFVKDIVTELRARQVLPTMTVLGMLIVGILRITTEVTTASTDVVGPAALWIAFLFAGLLAQERSFTVEQEQDCIYALFLAPVDAGTIFLAKLFVNIVILCIFETIIVPIVLVAFQLSFPDRWLILIGVLLLGNLGISGIGTLFSAIMHLTQTRGSLLSIIVLAILLPLMIPATFALMVLLGSVPDELIGTGALVFVGSLESAIGYMIAFDAIFVVSCWLMFGFVIKE
jgi:heme exporter protein B